MRLLFPLQRETQLWWFMQRRCWDGLAVVSDLRLWCHVRWLMSGGVIRCRPQSNRKDNARPGARSVTTSLSRTVMDERSSSEESRDVDELAAIRAFHSFIGKEKGKTVRGVEGLGCCSKAATFAKTHWVQVGLEKSVRRGWEEEKEALVPSRCRVEFLQQWPLGRRKTVWSLKRQKGCGWKNLGISMYSCISSHRDKARTTVDEVSLYHGDDKSTGLGFRDWVSKFTLIVFIFVFIFLRLPQVLSGHVDSLPLNISSSNVCLCNTGD